jgi:hypothetical protein
MESCRTRRDVVTLIDYGLPWCSVITPHACGTDSFIWKNVAGESWRCSALMSGGCIYETVICRLDGVLAQGNDARVIVAPN